MVMATSGSRRGIIMLAMPPLPPIFFIMRCICLCCFSKRLTSWIWVPEPFATRRLREPLMISGLTPLLRRHRVDDRDHAFHLLRMSRVLHRLGNAGHTGQLVDQAGKTAHVFHLGKLVA